MPLYVILNADGTQQRVGSSRDDVLAAGLAAAQTLLEIPDYDAIPDAAAWVWDAEQRAYARVPAVPAKTQSPTALTVEQFKRRFTQAERDRIDIAQSEHGDRLVRSRLRQIEKDLTTVQGQICDRAYPPLQLGVWYLTTVRLDGEPLLTPARAAEIIGADALPPE